jgi:DNA-directed RNA polymerase subunit K/omega
MPEEKNLPDPDEINLSDIDVNPDDSDVESVTLSEPPDSDEEDDDVDSDEDDEDGEDGEEDYDNDVGLGGQTDDEDIDEEDGDEEDSDEEDNMQKIDRSNINDYIAQNHPEKVMHNQEEIEALSKVFRNKNGDIEDEFHKTVPFITRFEKTKILGLRARQLNRSPEQALVQVDAGIIDGYKIALEEYKQKLIPFIVKRPLPNGCCEYWKFEDLIQLD